MLTTTPEYDAAIKATVRKIHSKVEITWTDPFIDPTIVVDANDKNRVHDFSDAIYHVADTNETVPYKYAHLNPDSPTPWVLDGTFHLAPGSTPEANKYQVGWWGNTLSSDPACTWATNPVLTMTFASRPIYSLLVCGEQIYGEYPVSFIVKIFTLSGDVVPVLTETVTSGVGTGWDRSKVHQNDSVAVKWIKTLATKILSAQKMTLEIVKWNQPNSVVKIVEFYTGIIGLYTDDDIISMGLLEEMEIADGSLPIGNISCNEMDLKIQNITDQFFVGNTDSPIYTVLKRNRRIRAWLGIKLPDTSTEWIIMGTFFSGDWQAGELDTYASTTARDRMELLRKASFETSELYENISLYDLAVIVLDDARTKIKDLVCDIDIRLMDFVLPYAWFEKTSYFNCIKTIAGACMGYAYIDKTDVLKIGTKI